MQELVRRLCGCEIRIGAHGAGNGRFYPWEELVELALGLERPWLAWREFGVDVVCCPGSSGGGDLEGFVEELREALDAQQVYVPLNGAGEPALTMTILSCSSCTAVYNTIPILGILRLGQLIWDPQRQGRRSPLFQVA